MYVRDSRSPVASSPAASHVMSRNRARDTAPELALRRALWAAGLRGYRTHARGIPGRPDVAFTRAKVAVFVHGCFWHACPEHSHRPKSNAPFWKAKFERNKKRDARKEAELREAGWAVLTFWEHEVRGDLARCIRLVGRGLKAAIKARASSSGGQRGAAAPLGAARQHAASRPSAPR